MAAPAAPRPGTASRGQARRCAVQAIYQWQVGGNDIGDIVKQFQNSDEIRKADAAYFEELLRGVIRDADTLDKHLGPLLDRPIAEVDPVERAILRMAAFEFSSRADVPYRVVINESVNLAKTFGAEQGHRFINGVLDKLARVLRPAETGGRTQR
jgi:N utilization substance protein B